MQSLNIAANIDAKNLKVADVTVGALQAVTTADVTTLGDIKFALTADKIKYDNYAIDSLLLNIAGKTTDHKISVSAKQSDNSISFTAAGGVKQKSWSGQLQQLQFNSKKYGDWHLAKPTAILLSKKSLQAKIDLVTNQLNRLSDLLPNVQNTRGNINLSIEVSGAIKKPTIQGIIQLTDGYADVPSVGVALRDVTITGSMAQTGLINWQASALAGSNRLSATGQSEALKAGFPTTLAITGSEITIANTREYNIIATPTLTLKYLNNDLSLNGTINIPKATIKTGEFSGSGVALSDDVVFVNHQTSKKADLPINFTSKIQINLGDNVTINTQGFSGRLQGSFLLNYDPLGLTTADGEIEILDGKFNAYGQALTISSGRLIYTGGPINNPVLNIQATRMVVTSTQNVATLGTGFMSSATFSQPGQVLVGINVTGPLKNYRLELFAQPAVFNQSDILSLLLLGTPASQLSSGSSQILLNAVSQLNIGGGQISRITNQLQSIFGLSQLGIMSESEYNPATQSILQEPSLVVGKQIGKRLYISYSVGIFNPINIVRLRYLLSHNLSIQTNASPLGQGVDLYYSAEKN